jgi:DNA polymerase-3 subunit delta
VKLAGAAAQRSAQKDLSPRFVMLSGPDGGALRRLGLMIAQKHMKLRPELELRRFNEDDLRANADCVEEAIAAPSLFGGAAIAMVRVSGEKDAGHLAGLLDRVNKGGPEPEGVLLLDVGDVARASKSRKMFEDSTKAWSLQLYETSRDELAATARLTAQDYGAEIEPATLAAIVEGSAQDMDSVAAEVAKLAIYAGQGGIVDMDTLEAVGSLSREAGLGEAIDAAFGGQAALMNKRLEQALASGANAVAITNAIGRHVRLLLHIQADMLSGQPTSEIVKNKRLGIFWKRQSDVARQAGLWGRAPLEEVLHATLETDRQIKRAGSPDLALLDRLLTRIAQRAAKRAGAS